MSVLTGVYVVLAVHAHDDRIAGYEEFHQGKPCVHQSCTVLQDQSQKAVSEGADYEKVRAIAVGLANESESAKGMWKTGGTALLTVMGAVALAGAAWVAKRKDDATGKNATVWAAMLAATLALGCLLLWQV